MLNPKSIAYQSYAKSKRAHPAEIVMLIYAIIHTMAGAAAGAELAAAVLRAGTATAEHTAIHSENTRDSMAYQSFRPPDNWNELNPEKQAVYLQTLDRETSRRMASHNRRMEIANAVTGAMQVGAHTSSAVMQANSFEDRTSDYFARETSQALRLHGNQVQNMQTKLGLRTEDEDAHAERTVNFLSKPMSNDVAVLWNAAEAKWPEHMERHADFISKTPDEQDRLLARAQIFKGIKTFFTNVSKVKMVLVSDMNCYNEEELTEIECKAQETVCFEDNMQAPLGLYTVRFVLDATAIIIEIECFVNRKLAGRSIQKRQLMIANTVCAR